MTLSLIEIERYEAAVRKFIDLLGVIPTTGSSAGIRFNKIFGTADDVTAERATHAAIDNTSLVDNDVCLILPGVTVNTASLLSANNVVIIGASNSKLSITSSTNFFGSNWYVRGVSLLLGSSYSNFHISGSNHDWNVNSASIPTTTFNGFSFAPGYSQGSNAKNNRIRITTPTASSNSTLDSSPLRILGILLFGSSTLSSTVGYAPQTTSISLSNGHYTADMRFLKPVFLRTDDAYNVSYRNSIFPTSGLSGSVQHGRLYSDYWQLRVSPFSGSSGNLTSKVYVYGV